LTTLFQYILYITITTNKVCYRIITSGTDESRIGRWSWILLRGKNGIRVRIITLYRPVKSIGATSTYQQQRQLFMDENTDECPRLKLMNDLRIFLQKSIELGDRLIVMGDFNEDVRSTFIHKFFKSLGMHESILNKHGNTAPNTYWQGTVPIDGIFTSKSIVATRCGYTSAKWGMLSDHRMIWIDLRICELLGENAPVTWTPQARRLKMNDPRTVTRLIQVRVQLMEEDNMINAMKDVSETITKHGITDEAKIQIERLDNMRVLQILEADRQCRKLRMGEVPWSPELQVSISRIRYFRSCKQKYMSRQTKTRTLLKLFKKTGLNTQCATLDEATSNLAEEYQQ
jgi:hypothetical protein